MLTRIAAFFFLGGSLLAASLPYRVEPAFAAVELKQPLAIVTPPGETKRLFILEKPGRIIVIDNLNRPTRRVFLDLTAKVGDDSSEQGILALAFHPDYARNRQFYIWYTSCLYSGFKTTREDRLSRFLVSAADPNVADPASEQPLIAQADEASNHNGGELAFGRDGYLYVSLGDEGAANDRFQNSQRIDQDFFSGILRLDVDRRVGSLPPNPHPAVRADSYAIPPDNPFVGATTFNGQPIDAAKVRTEFWAVGLRNPWRMSFDSATGDLWCADIGQNRFEEIDVIVRGGNYGWNFREGASAFRNGAPATAQFIEPIWDYSRSEGISITGGFVYRGSRHRDLTGRYLFADYGYGRVWSLQPDGTKKVGADRVRLIAQAPSIVSFGLDPRNGDILLASLTSEHLLRLVPAENVTSP